MIYRQIKNDEGEHLKPVTATYWNDHERAKSSKLQWHGRFTIHHGEANKTIWALVFTCQTIHDEALPYMYEGVRFVLPTATKEFGFRVPGLQYRLIFWLHVRIVADDFGWDRECLSILQLSDWGSCLDHLEISIHRPRKRLSVDEDTFMISFGDMIIDWEKIRMIRRVKFNVTGMDAGWVWDELEGRLRTHETSSQGLTMLQKRKTNVSTRSTRRLAGMKMEMLFRRLGLLESGTSSTRVTLASRRLGSRLTQQSGCRKMFKTPRTG